jgi:putative ABC transport system ATP-binding protein
MTLLVTNLQKSYPAATTGGQPVTVLNQINLTVAAGEFVAITGQSGVGKSTLLNCLAGLDDWQSGDITLNGDSLAARSSDARAHWRRDHVGFVFQAFHVLPHLTVAQNVALPRMLQGATAKACEGDVNAMLEAVGLQGMTDRLPEQLSGGQLQRVAIARALVHQPQLILADEPTGNLDPENGERIMRLLCDQAKATRAALVLVTHSHAAARMADRVLHLTPNGLSESHDSPERD